ncbi:hypothetical protein Nepgr_031798 [Nepenthes gracilis]|uniref:Uncharacterized protein n=1 Tax=Nepenthes gracilis TaxID=150966 RepID=A0AAD3Y760_NEPGR|nr:hypothetical protein Nepgr_031798 [Nepenthes gracilis]
MERLMILRKAGFLLCHVNVAVVCNELLVLAIWRIPSLSASCCFSNCFKLYAAGFFTVNCAALLYGLVVGLESSCGFCLVWILG